MGMENGMSRGFGVSDKGSSILESEAVSLGLKLQSTESSPAKMMMMSHHRDHHRPLSPSETMGGDGGSGPTCNSGATEVVGSSSSMTTSDIYRDDAHGATAAAVPAPCALYGAAAVVVRTLQPSDISSTITTTTSNNAFKSPAGGMAATLGFPFTSAQWKELERQAMIYKYMMAYVPVPPDLLLPITKSFPADPTTASHSSLDSAIFNLRFSNSKDPEPGRCKRTDGKKWRCSRDVAPHQKYCERHMHRGRPRSRKPVEVDAPLNTSKKTRVRHGPFPATPTSRPKPTVQANGSTPHLVGSTIRPNETHLSLNKIDHENICASAYRESSRGLDWLMDGKMVIIDTPEQQWQHLMQSSIGLTTENSIYNTSASVFQQDYGVEPVNLLSYTAGFGAPEDDQQNDDCAMFLNPDIVSLGKQTQTDTPRDFIDAWSNDNPGTNKKNESSVSSGGNLSPSSLTLSMAMAAGNALDEERGQIHMGLGVTDSAHRKPHVSGWQSPVSWVGSAPGGPLAEVLLPSTVATGSNPASPHASNGDAISPPATTVSSPSGVLQRTMLSLSDSSVCNSPTVAASTAAPEIVAFQWLN